MKYFYISCTHSGARGEHTTVATTMVCVCALHTNSHHTQTQTCAGDVNTHTAAARSALSFLLLLSLTHSLTIATILLAHFGLIGERVIRKFFDFNILYFACVGANSRGKLLILRFAN
uniref:(northern house mosquito) hypothetical protein n=1 Tax=Culex pipiens TaxID=7175 RepID=A0A8D8LDU0_CULPI